MRGSKLFLHEKREKKKKVAWEDVARANKVVGRKLIRSRGGAARKSESRETRGTDFTRSGTLQASAPPEGRRIIKVCCGKQALIGGRTGEKVV